MTDEQANNWRLYASEILRKLYFAGRKEELQVLINYAKNAIELINEEM